MPPETDSLSDTIARLAAELAALPPGPLAELRRLQSDGPGSGTFWRLAVKNSFTGDNVWLTFVRLLAILTPRGAPGPHKHLHNPRRAFGTALGDSAYPEPRLLRFLALPLAERPAALERMVRWLAAHDTAPGLNCIDIFWLLRSDKVQQTRKLAETYYRATDFSPDKKDAA